MDVEQCLQAVMAHYPHLSFRKAIPVEAGWDYFVLDVELEGDGLTGKDYIFRFPRRRDVKAQQAKEFTLLPWLASRLALQIPKPAFTWFAQLDDEIGFLGYPKIPGAPLSQADLGSTSIAAQLGWLLTQLHSIPAKQLAGLPLPEFSPNLWQREQLAFYSWTRAHVFPQLPAAQAGWGAWLWESYLSDAENFKFQPSLIHSDLGEEHILVDLEHGNLTGIIDWGDARQGDPALDFTGLFLLGNKGLVDKALAAYSASGFKPQNLERFWKRIIFYARLIPFHYIRNGLQIGKPLYIQQGRQWLEAMVDQGTDLLEYSPVSAQV